MLLTISYKNLYRKGRIVGTSWEEEDYGNLYRKKRTV